MPKHSYHTHCRNINVIERTMEPDITLTLVDEAPRLASYSLFPIVEKFLSLCGISVEARDISLAARILAQFPERLAEHDPWSDDLHYLGELAKTSKANIIKLPNISASIPQLKSAIAELQTKGFDVPDFVDKPVTDEEIETQKRYGKVLGSAVNPVLREGNSDRRAPDSVKTFAKKTPHRMGKWSKSSLTHVSTMNSSDFRHNEQSVTVDEQFVGEAKICFYDGDGKQTILAPSVPLDPGAVVDTTYMSVDALQKFYRAEIVDAKKRGVLFSVHLKATMMKISDPVIFGYAVKIFFEELILKHQQNLDLSGFNPNNGIGDLLAKVDSVDETAREQILSDLMSCLQK